MLAFLQKDPAEEGFFSFLDKQFLDNSLWLWAAALGVGLGTFLVLLLIRKVVSSKFEALAKKTDNKLDDIVAGVVKKTHALFLFAMGVLAGSFVLDLGGRADYLRQALVVVALVQAGLWGVALFKGSIEYWKAKHPDVSADVAMVAVGFLGKLAIWATILLLSLDNLGVDVTALIASMGIGGIAIALAAQNILADLFSSISIILDKPFEIGDFIIVGDLMGTVETIGLKTTRVKSLSGEQLVFSNTDLLGSRIRNYKRMKERRISFTIGVIYETPYEKLEKIPGVIKAIIEVQENASFSRSHFSSFGDFSLNFDTVYFVKVPDYNAYMDIQQSINLALFKKFEQEKIAFAYPTQMVYHQAQPGAAPEPPKRKK